MNRLCVAIPPEWRDHSWNTRWIPDPQLVGWDPWGFLQHQLILTTSNHSIVHDGWSLYNNMINLSWTYIWSSPIISYHEPSLSVMNHHSQSTCICNHQLSIFNISFLASACEMQAVCFDLPEPMSSVWWPWSKLWWRSHKKNRDIETYINYIRLWHHIVILWLKNAIVFVLEHLSTQNINGR